MRGIKPTTIVTEAYPLAVNMVDPIVTLIISIILLIYFLLLLGFISLALLVTEIGPCLSSSISTFNLLHIDEIILVPLNILLIILVWLTTDDMSS